MKLGEIKRDDVRINDVKVKKSIQTVTTLLKLFELSIQLKTCFNPLELCVSWSLGVFVGSENFAETAETPSSQKLTSH